MADQNGQHTQPLKAKEPFKYISRETSGPRQRVLNEAGRYRPGPDGSKPESIWEHVTHEAAASYHAVLRDQVGSKSRRTRGRLWKMAGNVGASLHGAHSTRVNLMTSRATTIYHERLLSQLSLTLNAVPRWPRLATKALIVLAELVVVGQALTRSLSVDDTEGYVGSVGLTVAMLAIPALAGVLVKNAKAQMILREGNTPRLVYERAASMRSFKFLEPKAAVIVFLSFVFTVGVVLGLVIGWTQPAAGVLTAAVIIVSNIGMAATEYKYISIESDAISALRWQSRRNGLRHRLLVRKEGKLAKLTRDAMRLRLIHVSASSDGMGRLNAALSEASVAAGSSSVKSIEDAREAFFFDSQEFEPFNPSAWVTDPVDWKKELDQEFEQVRRFIEQLDKAAERLLETVSVPDSESSSLNGAQPNDDQVIDLIGDANESLSAPSSISSAKERP